MQLLCPYHVMLASIEASQILTFYPVKMTCYAAADGVVHTAFLHDGSVPYLEATKIDCAAIKAMTDAMAGTEKPFVMSSGTGVMGKIWSA